MNFISGVPAPFMCHSMRPVLSCLKANFKYRGSAPHFLQRAPAVKFYHTHAPQTQTSIRLQFARVTNGAAERAAMQRARRLKFQHATTRIQCRPAVRTIKILNAANFLLKLANNRVKTLVFLRFVLYNN